MATLSFWDRYAVSREHERYIADLSDAILARTGLESHPHADKHGRLALIVSDGHGTEYRVTDGTQTDLPHGLDVRVGRGEMAVVIVALTVAQTHKLCASEIAWAQYVLFSPPLTLSKLVQSA